MAKNKNPLLQLQGTFATVTFVNSKSYGKHVRRPRGTVKKAKLNTSLKQNASKAGLVNGTAKVVHDSIKTIACSFKQPKLWQAMLSRLRKVASGALPDLLRSLEGLEINSAYPMSYLMTLPRVYFSANGATLHLTLETLQHPQFAKGVRADGYYYTVHVLWIGTAGAACGTDCIETEWIRFRDALPSYELAFDVPVAGCYAVVLLDVQAGAGEQVVEVMAGRGMRVVVVAPTPGKV